MSAGRVLRVVTAGRVPVAVITQSADGNIHAEYLDPRFQADLEVVIACCRAFGIPVRKHAAGAGSEIGLVMERVLPGDEDFIAALRDEINSYQIAGQNLYGLVTAEA